MENLIIRKATITDSNAIAALLYIAMDDIIARLINDENSANGIAFLQHFVQQKDNQYSWQNCWVLTIDDTIQAAINIYDGAALEILRLPILNYIHTIHSQKINPENETQAGEWYIDSLGVNKTIQGKGLGSILLEFVIDEFVNKKQQTLGLLVDVENPKAKVLYERLGFKVVGDKTLMGHQLQHMQLMPIDRFTV